MKYACALTMLVLALASGCAHRVQKGVSLPSLPPGFMPGQGEVPALVELPPPRQARITLAWECIDFGEGNSLLITGLVASTNLTDWAEVVRLPYAARNQYTLTNRPPREFYRAFNAWK